MNTNTLFALNKLCVLKNTKYWYKHWDYVFAVEQKKLKFLLFIQSLGAGLQYFSKIAHPHLKNCPKILGTGQGRHIFLCLGNELTMLHTHFGFIYRAAAPCSTHRPHVVHRAVYLLACQKIVIVSVLKWSPPLFKKNLPRKSYDHYNETLLKGP